MQRQLNAGTTVHMVEEANPTPHRVFWKGLDERNKTLDSHGVAPDWNHADTYDEEDCMS